jgi:2'-hydroxyisoflavone reductase
MDLGRRDFMKTAALAGGGLSLGGFGHAVAGHPSPARALRILILGGTGFIGPHQVAYARGRGHALTLFNRGRTAPGLFPDVEQLHGDRATGELGELGGGREWDAVIDNSATDPRWVREAAQLLRGRARQYIFISTQSVYASRAEIGMDETAPVGRPELPREEWTGYGPSKALAEEEARAAFPDGATVVRPSLIVGPGDETDRWTYWAVRVERGGEVAAPGTPQDPVQFIDARDLSEWVIRLAESGAAGTFNAVGPQVSLTSAEMLYGIRAVTTAPVSFTWVDADFLAEQGVRPWSDMPAWQPPRGRTAGFARMSNARALAAGLTFRPLAVTARDTLEWFASLPGERRTRLNAGLPAERERYLLAAWKVRRSGAEDPASAMTPAGPVAGL